MFHLRCSDFTPALWRTATFLEPPTSNRSAALQWAFAAFCGFPRHGFLVLGTLGPSLGQISDEKDHFDIMKITFNGLIRMEKDELEEGAMRITQFD